MAATAALHPLLLLADSALPLGSFAFSSGLESFLAHQKHAHPSAGPTTSAQLTTPAQVQQFESFLLQSLQNTASTALPFVLTAWRDPAQLPDLDNDFDASVPCTVARRASIAQGRALLAVWERALSSSFPTASPRGEQSAREAVTRFAASMKSGAAHADPFALPSNAHLPPLFGAVSRAGGLSADDTAYVFLLNHAKAILSAAVRASVFGPYQSQAVLASGWLQECIRECIAREQDRPADEAAVCIPTMDLWMGRHEMLYSRIFNS